MRLQAQLVLLAAALLIVSRGAAAGAGALAGTGSSSLPLRRVEDDVMGFAAEAEAEAAYPQRRVLYDSRYVGYNGLTASQAACYGPCPGRGQPYSGRGCKSIYQCG